MSMWKKALRGVVRGVAAYYTGGASEAILAKARAGKAASSGFVPTTTSSWSGATTQGRDMSMNGYQRTLAVLPRSMPGIGRSLLAPGLGYRAGRAVGTAARSAMTYCRRHPAWCAGAGGLAAVEALVSGGQLPPVKRRRARGISGRELSAFRRVSKTLNKWCKVPAPTQARKRPC